MDQVLIEFLRNYPVGVWIVIIVVVATFATMLWLLISGRSISIGSFVLGASARSGVVIKTVKKKNRSEFSGQLVTSTRSEIHVFGGDLSWLASDYQYFDKILRNGKKVKILVDSPDEHAVDTLFGKQNVEMRHYPNGEDAPLKGFIIDPSKSHTGDCRAVTIRKRNGEMGDAEITYEFVEYTSRIHSEAVNGLISWFDTLFNAGAVVKKK